MDPIRDICYRRFPWGDNGFREFQKVRYNWVFLKTQLGSSITNKMERLSSGPSRALLSQFPSGDKGFRDFQKVGYSRVFLKTQLWFVNHIYNGKTFKWTLTGTAFAVPFGGLNDFRKHIGFYGRIAGTQLILRIKYKPIKKRI